MIRLVLRTIPILLGLGICVPLHYAWKLALGKSPWPRRYLFWVGYCIGLRTRTVGRPLPDHVLFVANHLSWLDIMLLAGASGATFVSKAEVGDTPVIGWLARLHDTVFVARTERRAVKGQADALRTALASGQPVALFPEGTTDGGVDILPFRPSLLSALFPPLPGIVVQPVAIDYGPAGEDIAWVGAEPGGANVKRVLSRRGTIPVTLHFLPAIDPAEAADRKVLAERCRTEIVRSLGAPAAAPAPASAGFRSEGGSPIGAR